MLVLRVVALFALLFLGGLGIAFLVTKDRKYLRVATRTLQAAVVLGVAAGLLYLFERVLLFL